jgi:hypothetical protein
LYDTAWTNPRAEESFSGVDIPESGDAALIHEEDFRGLARGASCCDKGVNGELFRERLRSELACEALIELLAGNSFHPGKSTIILKNDSSTIVELNYYTSRGGVEAMVGN